MKPSVYVRPKNAGPIPVTKRRDNIPDDFQERPKIEPVVVHASSECHVTPIPIAEAMADFLFDAIMPERPGWAKVAKILEPSAGTGNLIKALYAHGQNDEDIVAIEINYDLCKILRKTTEIEPICMDFLEYGPDKLFDGIIMNPPFSKVQSHIAKACGCLAKNGVIIALVPITFKLSKSLQEHFVIETLEELSRHSFPTCNVSTKIVKILK